MAQLLTTKEIADKLDTEPKRLRRFLRSEDSPLPPVGKGNRYQIEARQFRTLRKSFINWSNAHTRNRSAA